MQSKVDVSAEIEDMEKEFDDDTESIITNERYVYISSIIDACYTKNKKRTMSTSDKIDRIGNQQMAGTPYLRSGHVSLYIMYPLQQ